MNKPRTERPPLEWSILHTFLGPEPKVPANVPDYIKRRPPRFAACQVSVATAGFDPKTKTDRIRFSLCLGWSENGEFKPLRNLPMDRWKEFKDVGDEAHAKAPSMLKKG